MFMRSTDGVSSKAPSNALPNIALAGLMVLLPAIACRKLLVGLLMRPRTCDAFNHMVLHGPIGAYNRGALSLNYFEHGFIRRGLGGTLLRGIAGSPLAGCVDELLVFHLLSAIWLTIPLALLVKWAIGRDRKAAAWLAILLVASPQLFWAWGGDLGRIDMFVEGCLAWGVIALVTRICLGSDRQHPAWLPGPRERGVLRISTAWRGAFLHSPAGPTPLRFFARGSIDWRHCCDRHCPDGFHHREHAGHSPCSGSEPTAVGETRFRSLHSRKRCERDRYVFVPKHGSGRDATLSRQRTGAHRALCVAASDTVQEVHSLCSDNGASIHCSFNGCRRLWPLAILRPSQRMAICRGYDRARSAFTVQEIGQHIASDRARWVGDNEACPHPISKLLCESYCPAHLVKKRNAAEED